MTRAEVVERMNHHRERAEACLSLARVKPADSPPSHDYQMVNLSASIAHGNLALFYQGELRDVQP